MADPEPPAGGLDAFERFPLLHDGLIDLVGKGEIGPDSNVLYVHLGGAPALNGYSALFR